MLRITVQDGADGHTVKLEGRLASVWADELRKFADALLHGTSGRSIAIDLTDVSFVDVAGKRVLSALAKAGVQLVSSDPLMDALVAEIQTKRPPNGGNHANSTRRAS